MGVRFQWLPFLLCLELVFLAFSPKKYQLETFFFSFFDGKAERLPPAHCGRRRGKAAGAPAPAAAPGSGGRALPPPSSRCLPPPPALPTEPALPSRRPARLVIPRPLPPRPGGAGDGPCTRERGASRQAWASAPGVPVPGGGGRPGSQTASPVETVRESGAKGLIKALLFAHVAIKAFWEEKNSLRQSFQEDSALHFDRWHPCNLLLLSATALYVKFFSRLNTCQRREYPETHAELGRRGEATKCVWPSSYGLCPCV